MLPCELGFEADEKVVTDPRILDLVELARKTGDVDQTWFDNALRTVEARPDPDAIGRLRQVLVSRMSARQNHLDEFFPFPSEEEISGEFRLGTVKGNGIPFGLHEQELSSHLICTGRSGCGKTNLNYVLLSQMYGRIPCWIFDLKRDYRHLIRPLPGIQVIRWQDFRYNPLRAEGVDPLEWLQAFLECYCHSFTLLLGSKTLLIEEMNELYGAYGVYEEREKSYPSLLDLADFLKAKRYPGWSINAGFAQRSINRLTSIVAATGKMFDCERGFPLERMLGRNIVFELDGMTEEIQGFLIEILLTWLFMHGMSLGERGRTRHVAVLDEAARVFDAARERTPAMGIASIDILVSRVREYGLGLIVSCQEPSKTTSSLRANSSTKVSFSLGSGYDALITSQSMNLRPEQMEQLKSLKTGEAIVKLADRYTDPFVMDVPYFPLAKDVSDEEVRAHSGDFIAELMKDTGPRVRLSPLRQRSEPALSQDAEMMLYHIGKFPFMSTVERFAAMGLSSYMGTRVKNELLAKGYVTEAEINLMKRGGRPKINGLTEKGLAFLSEKGFKVRTEGRGGLQHRYWQNRMAEHYRGQGCRVMVEARTGDSYPDLLVTRPDGQRWTIEICLDAEYELEKVKTYLGFDFERMVFVARDRETKDRLVRKASTLSPEVLSRLRFLTVHDYLAGNDAGTDSGPQIEEKRKRKKEKTDD